MASTGVNVKMGVSGIAQFKQNISTAKNSLKTLDAQLALNEKQFKATGDSESYMQEKSELLKVKLEEQKSIVSNAEKALKDMTERGVDKASKAYQDMQQQLLKAKGDLLDTEQQMQGVAEAGDEAGDAVSEMNAQMKRIGDGVNYQNVTQGLDSITDGMRKVMSKAWQMGEAIVKATLGAGSWADELKTTAAQYGIDEETLQRMRKTANLIDTDVDTILSAKQKMTQGIGKRDKEAMGAFAALLGEGYDPTVQKAEDNFWAIGKALMALDDEYEQQVYAQKLFGKSWKELVPLFTTGREEYEKTMDSWSVVEKDQIDNLGKMDDQYQKMQSEFETFKMELLSAFSGPLTEGMEAITGLFKELNDYLDTPEGQAMLKQMGDTISSLITDLTQIDPADVVAGLQSVINGITEALKWIDANRQTVVTAMEAIIGGWAALKVTGGVLKVLEVVNGLQWLKKNPNITIPGTESAGAGAAAAGSSGGLGAITGKLGAVAAKLAPVASVAVASAGMFFGLESWAHERDWGEFNRNEAANAGRDNPLLAALAAGVHGIDANGLDYDWEPLFREHADELRALSPDNPLWDLISNFADLSDGLDNAEIDDLFNNWFEYGLKGEDFVEMFRDAYNKMSETADELTGESETQKRVSDALSKATDRINGLPGIIEDAITTAMSGIRIEIDGQTAGQVLTPYISAGMGGFVMAMEK